MRLSADALQARYRVEDTEVHGNVFFRHTGLAARNLTATLARLGLVVETPLLKSRARGVPNLTGRIRKGLMEEPTLAETFPMFCQPQEQRLAIPEI
jgi:hypothetical protein